MGIALAAADIVLVTDVYAAREAPEPGISGKMVADAAMDAAACIGCGACVAACPNASASLFTAAKIAQLSHLPQGGPERKIRVRNMVQQMDKEGFGACSKHYECEAACPKEIKVDNIAKMNKEYLLALLG